MDGESVFTDDELASLLDRSDLHWGKMKAVEAPTIEDKDLAEADRKRKGPSKSNRGRKKKNEEKQAASSSSELFKVIDVEEASSTLLPSVKQEE